MALIINPLLNNNNNNNINLEEFINDNKFIYFLIKKNDLLLDEEFFNYEIDIEIYNKNSQNLLLYEFPYNNKLKNHLYNALVLHDNQLTKFNIFNYKLKPINIVIPILNINFINFIEYIKQYEIITLDNISKIFNINKYLNSSQDDIITIINNLDNNSYFNNNKLNLTYKFNTRRFNYNITKTNNNKLVNIFNDNYLNNKFENNFIDISKLINKYDSDNNNKYNSNDIYNLLLKLDNKLKFLLFSNLLISKKYCYLVFNNQDIISLMLPIINTYYYLFRYLIGYAWISFYIDECCTNNINENDNFIFKINTASLLPVYPILYSNPKLNPYFTLLVSDLVLHPSFNFCGVDDNCDIYTNKGICNLNEFKERLNLFCTKNINTNLFENINFQKLKIGICGSVMAACLQKYHPLLHIFKSKSFEEKFLDYVEEYYSNSDIDIMFLENDKKKYLENVNIFFNQICININKFSNTEHETTLEIKIICNLFVSKSYINNMIIPNISDNLNYIQNNLLNEKIIELFKPLYTELIDKEFSDISLDDNLKKYVIIKLFISNNDNNNIVLNLKHKIKSTYLKHTIEMFLFDKPSFIEGVSKFHLPCIRAYYDNLDVYMTPSCITAHLTYMNIDYKYIYASTDPISIINKYRLRGFGTWLSHLEKNKLKEYNNVFDYYKKIYENNNLFGENIIFDNIYKMNKDDKDRYYSPLTYKRYSIFKEMLNRKFKSTYNDLLINYHTLQTINEDGFIKPINKYLINILC